MEESKEDVKKENAARSLTLTKILKYFFLAGLSIGLGGVHYQYVSNLFENDRNFSYLSDLEREMSLRTEMGFYYSYYKTIVEERPFIAGISTLMYDKLVEYPKEVNAFNRFNIHPEVIIGAVYRYLEPVLNTSDYRECHLIKRDEGHGIVRSCVGIGHPMMFYLGAVWLLAGLTVAALFLHAVALSESIIGGLLAVLQYFANHAECTRVQWAPNERENLALPLLLLQGWLLTLQLRDKYKKTSFRLQISISILNCLCLLFWQFTQFIFLTQMAIFFLMEQLHVIDIKAFSIFLHSHFCGLHLAVFLLQGNDMLKSSLYTSFFLIVSLYCLFFSSLRIKVQTRVDLFVESWLIILRIGIAACASFYLKTIISDFLEVQEDSHVWDILFSKFTEYKTFHTLIYTCSEVFDFLPLSTVESMFMSCLIPIMLLNSINIINVTLVRALRDCEGKVCEYIHSSDSGRGTGADKAEDKAAENNSDTEVKGRQLTDLDVIEESAKTAGGPVEKMDVMMVFLKCLQFEPAVFYNMAQMAVYGVMAALVMRLKLLFATQMCLLASLILNKNYFIYPKTIMKSIPVIWLLMMVPVLRSLYLNVSQEMSHVGEFSDYQQEELLQWIASEAGSGAFAGSMPVLATVMLCTRKPVVAHPHYEHQEARQRAYSVYKVYGRFSSEDLYYELSKLKATFLIVETKYCYGRSSVYILQQGLLVQEIWEAEAPSPSNQPLLCHTLLTEPVEHFYPVFRNSLYAVFRVHDYSVRYMPRIFAT